MKTIETIIYMKQELTVLVTADDRDRATVEYFLNGVQVTYLGALKRDFQELFTTLADVVCKSLSLTKW